MNGSAAKRLGRVVGHSINAGFFQYPAGLAGLTLTVWNIDSRATNRQRPEQAARPHQEGVGSRGAIELRVHGWHEL